MSSRKFRKKQKLPMEWLLLPSCNFRDRNYLKREIIKKRYHNRQLQDTQWESKKCKGIILTNAKKKLVKKISNWKIAFFINPLLLLLLMFSGEIKPCWVILCRGLFKTLRWSFLYKKLTPLTIFAKRSILNLWQRSERVSLNYFLLKILIHLPNSAKAHNFIPFNANVWFL